VVLGPGREPQCRDIRAGISVAIAWDDTNLTHDSVAESQIAHDTVLCSWLDVGFEGGAAVMLISLGKGVL
jgi:hypothetical protein